MSKYRDYDFDMTYDGKKCTGYHREWRNHEANIWRINGRWMGDMIAYGEWGDLDGTEAEAVAHAFGLLGADKLSEGGYEMFQWYFGGRKVL